MTDKKYTQFSKRLAVAITVFWFAMRILSAIIVWLNVESSDAVVAMIKGIDDIMMVNISLYTGNSVSEKISNNYFNAKRGENADADDDIEG